MGAKLTEFLLEGNRGGRPAVSGVGAIVYRGYQTGEARENSASDRGHGDWGRESDAGSHRPWSLPLSCGLRLAVGGLLLAVYSSRLTVGSCRFAAHTRASKLRDLMRLIS